MSEKRREGGRGEEGNKIKEEGIRRRMKEG